ncbi:gibberellin 2-beta-dioxygenase 2-like [Nicotiana tabacum]|uniref:Gibberellin 2-beta-dioxygenase 2-like n=2 Tax=Nicotiana TaxID=4085 RepID=A0A1S4D0R4_TOBAC|nr:PREDICTED: gibberellin 2-beta-dioxygenase 2-like isoform X1 [Nicotiana sylvestris]XP_016506908.1 PREDICTED: gibberellin 2-beta-dioxygenase 2-like [Nicotiana tabacum]
MVLATSSEKIRDIELPIIDLSLERSEVLKHIVKASEEFGFFKVINHKVPEFIIKRMEDESYSFFSKTSLQKQCAGPANPYGYGCKNIGFNGDNGEVEYLLLHANPLSISQTSKTISSDPITFSSTVDGYVAEVKELACEILELMAQGLRVPHISVFSKFLRDLNSDSLLRLNYYPPLITNNIHQLIIHDLLEDDITDASPISSDEARIFSKEVQTCHHRHQQCKIGFGEHTDPQILTVLRSNDVGGLQISPQDGLWIPVSPHPNTAFSIFVGDTLQALTNGRFKSVRHRAIVNSCKTRMSMVYFGAPAPHARISCPSELVTPHKSYLYRPFTWAEYKKATYSRKLGDTRLQCFRVQSDNSDEILSE